MKARPFSNTADSQTPHEAIYGATWFTLECSLAPSGVGFKSLYYVSQPQGRGKSSKELMREASEKRTRAKDLREE